MKYVAGGCIMNTLSVVCLIFLASTIASAQGGQKSSQSSPTCSSDWNPICARTHKNLVATYSNWCFAERDDARKIRDYEEGAACPEYKCPSNFEPVCANDKASNQIRAYVNSCYAKSADAPILISYDDLKNKKIKVKGGLLNIDRICPNACGTELEVVCAKDPDNQDKPTLYRNRCYAVLAKAPIIKPGPCDN